MGAHDWLAGIANHGNSTLSRGWLAGCQWRPLDILGTQLPLLQLNADVNGVNLSKILCQRDMKLAQ